jgi:hypothetical protein
MKLSAPAKMICLIALMGALWAPHGRADEWNKKTVVTFGAPVEIPGVHLKGWAVLPAGTYVFKLLDSQSDRNIVQIWNRDETKVYATILAIPDSRLKATDKTVITFDERPVGEPVALRAWFYPGSRTGEEFVYPKARAMELAKSSNLIVPFTTVEIPVEVTEEVITAAAPAVVAMKTAPVKVIQPTGEETKPAPVATLPSTGRIASSQWCSPRWFCHQASQLRHP